MTDLSKTIEPKSDQLNADDLIAGPMTVRVTKVSANMSSPDQPISIFFEGDNGKPYKPCKSMRRVFVHTWGSDGLKYPGRSVTLYCEPTVKFGGIAVGGIRISHMSDIKAPVTMALTASRGSRKPYTVQPLTTANTKQQDAPSNASTEPKAGEGKVTQTENRADAPPTSTERAVDEVSVPALPPVPRGVDPDVWMQACEFASDGKDELTKFINSISADEWKSLQPNLSPLRELFPKVAT